MLTSTPMPGAVVTDMVIYNSFWRLGGVRVRSKKSKHSPWLMCFRSVKVKFTPGFKKE